MNNISFLKDLLSIYSPSGLEKEISEYLIKNLNLSGFNANCDEVGNVVATIGNGKPNIVFLGHRPCHITLYYIMEGEKRYEK